MEIFEWERARKCKIVTDTDGEGKEAKLKWLACTFWEAARFLMVKERFATVVTHTFGTIDSI